MRAFKLGNGPVLAPEFVAAVAAHEARGGWWRCGAFFARLSVDGRGRVLMDGKSYLIDTVTDKRNGHLRGVWEAFG